MCPLQPLKTKACETALGQLRKFTNDCLAAVSLLMARKAN